CLECLHLESLDLSRYIDVRATTLKHHDRSPARTGGGAALPWFHAVTVGLIARCEEVSPFAAPSKATCCPRTTSASSCAAVNGVGDRRSGYVVRGERKTFPPSDVRHQGRRELLPARPAVRPPPVCGPACGPAFTFANRLKSTWERASASGTLLVPGR